MMPRQAMQQASRLATRAATRSTIRFAAPILYSVSARSVAPGCQPSRLGFSTWPARTRGIMPDTENPATEAEKTETSTAIVELTESQYHELADTYLEKILSRLEELQDEREDLDVEYSAGVMTVTTLDKGTYVINKQPPNKQIWLSSPHSGPKRYDWCVIGDGQNNKEGTASGGWIYARDGSSLNDVFLAELGVDLEGAMPE
ncbi:hypothetical protein S7711_07229 [Stachybotrys chartarum IBT 7711]|uniref:ferroxidase n=1 Tax=Stachybotrys chartarum (strain CBS 109288 / IBT 7711) TaxID=1280523 RepID=A0A084AGQ2_STACB|nr:hypothetical protein S7711_07229 [Stachybotrys chartarum IBT 7711]